MYDIKADFKEQFPYYLTKLFHQKPYYKNSGVSEIQMFHFSDYKDYCLLESSAFYLGR
jgi:hypothetical protein